MSTERIVLVGTVWAVLLLALLVLREFVRAVQSRSKRRILPVLDKLVVVMIVAFSLAAVIRLGSLVSPPGTAASPSAVPSGPIAGVSPSASQRATPTPTPPVEQTPGPVSPTPTLSVTPPPGSTPTPEPPPTPTPEPQPTPSPGPTPTPTPSPTPTPTPTPTPLPVGAGEVSVPARFTAYSVRDGRVVSFRQVRSSAPVTARASEPRTFALPTFSDPNGQVTLVQMLTGPYARTWVSPDDPGVRYTPG